MIDKIDLSTIDSSTRPKKTVKKKATEETPGQRPEEDEPVPVAEATEIAAEACRGRKPKRLKKPRIENIQSRED